jgi:thioredoxin reductase/NAD-dependent dihydropyrimidine dehydrogenase PreA subunit
MHISSLATWLYLIPLVVVVVLYYKRHRRTERHFHDRWVESSKAGLAEPVTLHPVVDPTICIGSGACVKACPEQALGLVNRKSVLVAPDHCIGHGACQAACPVEAIQLVFGTEKRGIDIPYVKPTFETNVPGIYIAGELGGMGLIRKGIDQGVRAVETIRRHKAGDDQLDLVIVGAGPAGIGASLAAKEAGLRFVTIEQEDSLGGAIFHYPRRKVAMTAPMQLPIVGRFDRYEISKEELLEFWNGVIKQTGLRIRFSDRMEGLVKEGSGFLVKTSKTGYKAKNVLLAIGRRGTPRKLGVAGEELSKVVYRLIDAEQYRGLHVLVVGGGDSAAEAALAVAAERDTTVVLACRGDEIFSRPKDKNRRALKRAVAEKRLRVALHCAVTAIGADSVTLEQKGNRGRLKNDAVIVCAGGTLPTPMLKDIGVMVETYYGQPAPQ